MKELKPPGKGRGFGTAFYSGEFAGRRLVYAVSGIGKVNAAHTAALLIHDWKPSAVVIFGIGGAYPSSGLKVGDVAVATKENYADEGVLMRDGFHGLKSIGIPILRKGRRRFFNEFLLDRRLASAALRAARVAGTARAGLFLTVSTCTGTTERARELESIFPAICESMEGAAAVHVCSLYGIPCAEIRGISNIVEDRNRDRWDIPLAAENCQVALRRLLESPSLPGKDGSSI
jgi:futalosine hydrolase